MSSEQLTPQEREELVRRWGDWSYWPDGTLKADWLLRLGPVGWAARCKANRRNMWISRARLALWRRRGYWFDEERRLRAPVAPSAVPVSAEAHSDRSPRRQTRRASRSRARSPTGDPSEPSPEPLRVVPLARFRRDVAAWLEAVGR
jgi:hypothetical protein